MFFTLLFCDIGLFRSWPFVCFVNFDRRHCEAFIVFNKFFWHTFVSKFVRQTQTRSAEKIGSRRPVTEDAINSVRTAKPVHRICRKKINIFPTLCIRTFYDDHRCAAGKTELFASRRPFSAMETGILYTSLSCVRTRIFIYLFVFFCI